MEANEFTGRCHCGNIHYRFSTTQVLNGLPMRRCDCSFCRRHGAVYTSDPSGELELAVKEPEALRKYRFSSGVVDFLICGNCGVLTAALTEIDENTYAVVVANTLDERIPEDDDEKVAAEHLPMNDVQSPTTINLAEETLQEGMARRKRNWIGRVTLNYPS